MIVIGAGGFAIELIEILVSKKYNFNESNLFFFDNIHTSNNKLYNRFTILNNFNQIKKTFKKISSDFIIGVGASHHRFSLCTQFEKLGGNLVTIASSSSKIGSYENTIKSGSIIMDYTVLTNSVYIGKGTLINAYCFIGHGASIGNFCSIAPGVKVTGNVVIGDYVNIGTGAIILPNVKIGDNSFITAGSVVSKDIPENSKVVGTIPSRIIEKLHPFRE